MTLMKFADPSEGAKVYGPLYTAEANAKIPLFGPGKLTGDNITTHLEPELYQKLKDSAKPVIDLLASQTAADNADTDKQANTTTKGLDSLSISPKTKVSSQGKGIEGINDFSGDQTFVPARGNMAEIMLRRAKDKYLFDCAKNADIVSDNPELQDVWQWVKGKLKVPGNFSVLILVS